MSWFDFKSDRAEQGNGAAFARRSLIGNVRKNDAALRAGGGPFEHHPHPRYFDLIWLIYSAFFFIEPFQRNNLTYWIQFAAFYFCFVTLYVALICARTRRTAYWLLAALALLGLLAYPANSGACGMFIYVVAFAPFVTDSLAVCMVIFLLAILSMMAEGLLFHLNPWSWGFPAFLCLAIGAANTIAAQRMRANQKLHLAQEQIEHLAKVAERERIARDLHDVLGHTLSLVVLKSELAGKLLERDPGRARQEMADVEQIARTALGEVRQAIRGYRSEGLLAEIGHARSTLDAAGVTLECASEPPKLRPAEETVLALVVREAVTNIVRHAQASRCRMTFAANAGGASLIVEDDGRGGIREEGNGLRGMRERVDSLGGNIRIDSSQGTRLVIEIPAQTMERA